MGAPGTDLKLSPAARKLFPFYVEAKNRETINIWKALEQAEKGMKDGLHPLVVFRRNHSPTYAAIRWDKLLELLPGAMWHAPLE